MTNELLTLKQQWLAGVPATLESQRVVEVSLLVSSVGVPTLLEMFERHSCLGSDVKLMFHINDNQSYLAFGVLRSCSRKELKQMLEDTTFPLFGGLGFQKQTLKKDEKWNDIPHDFFFCPRFLISYIEGVLRLQCFMLKGEDVNTCRQMMESFLTDVTPKRVLTKSLSLGKPKMDVDWKQRVEKGVEAVKSRKLLKIVLSAEQSFHLKEDDTLDYISQVMAQNPATYHYLFQKGKTTVFSCSPEKLLEVRGERVSTTSLAGTTPLETPDEELLSSNKLIEENHHVLDFVKKTLGIYCVDIEVSPKGVLRLHHLKHLRYSIDAKLSKDASVIDLLLNLHPTPALAGDPVENSMDLIRSIEPKERHWYGGALGMMSYSNSHLCVGIRLGIIQGGTLTLYAGAGLTQQSIASDECDEIERKLFFGQLSTSSKNR